MKQTLINAKNAPQASGGYSQAVLLEQPTRFLYISGQIPESAAGDTPTTFTEQCQLVWANVLAQLEAADMGIANLVKVTTFLSSRDYRHENSSIRQQILGEHIPALTVIIAEIYDPAWLLEIDAVAAS
ncbi:MAG: RidA family protein [Deinococcota bacterium]